MSLGRIGESASALFGSMLVTHFELAALGRADVAEKDRRDFYLYIDEFPTVATESSASVMPVARKYRLCLIMLMQSSTSLTRICVTQFLKTWARLSRSMLERIQLLLRLSPRLRQLHGD